MKKLMTVIAAVAMSFGLFATPASHFISFEEADKCVDENGKLQQEKWTGDASVIDLVGCYGYPTEADARRDEKFAGGTDNYKCLKLETGNNQVVCTPGGDTDNIYFDQVVKFTGYEEAPTVTDGKIAVWMSAIETEGTEGEDGYIAGETNLYVTCAMVDISGEATPTNICLGAYDIDAWHRVTIKSLGDIAAEDGRAGFLVYIDGAQVSSFAGIAASAALKPEFQSYSASGLLFPALDAEVATVTSVAYQGIGELDDVAIDEDGPQFARFVEGTVAAINGATLALTNLTDMTEVTVGTDGKFQVAPNSSLLFTYTAIPGNFLTGGKETATATGNIGDKQEFDFNDEIESLTKVASYVDEAGDDSFAASIQDALDETVGGVKLLINTTISEPVVVPAEFADTIDLNGKTVTYTANEKWAFRFGDDGECDASIANGTIESSFYGVRVNQTTLVLENVTINSAMRALQGTAASEITLDGCELNSTGDEVAVLMQGGTIDLTGTEITAVGKCLDLSADVTATIDADSSVETTGNTPTIMAVYTDLTVAGTVKNTYDQWPESDAGRFAYAICGNGNDTDGVTLTIVDDAVVSSANMTAIYFPCAGMLDIGAAEITGTEGVYVKAGTTAIVDGATITATLTDDKVEAYAAKGDGFKNTGDAFVVDNCNYPAGTPTVSITGGTFESAAGVAVASYAKDGFDRVTGFIEGGLFKGVELPETDLIAAEEGYRGKWVEDEDGFYKPDTELINYVAQIGDVKYETLAQALAEAESGDVIELLAAVTIDADTTVATDITLALGAYNLVIADGNTLAINDDVEVTRTTGGVQNLGSISVAAEKTLDMATFGWGAGLIPATDDKTNGKFAIAGTVKFAAGTDPVAMATVNPDFFTGTVEGAKFFAGEVEYTYTSGEWKLPVVTYDITIGKLDNATLTIDGKAAADFKAEEGKTYVLAVEPADGYENAKIYFNGAEITAGDYVFTAAGTLTADAQKKQQGWPEEGDPTIIDKTAAEAFEGKIPTVLADVPAQKFTVWAKKAGLDFANCKPADVDVDAYLLNCKPDEVVAEKAKAVSAIKITSITFDGEKWVITSGTYGENSAYGANAKVHFEEVTIEGADTTNAKFWQATLVPDTTPAND